MLLCCVWDFWKMDCTILYNLKFRVVFTCCILLWMPLKTQFHTLFVDQNVRFFQQNCFFLRFEFQALWHQKCVLNCMFSTNLLKVVWIYRFQTNCFDKIVFTSCIFKPANSRVVQIVQLKLCCCVVFEYQEWELCCCKLYNCCVKLYLRQAWWAHKSVSV